MALVAGFGHVVDVLPTGHEAGVHISHLSLHQLGRRKEDKSTGRVMFLPEYSLPSTNTSAVARKVLAGLVEEP